jgi:hypothetical protein
MKKLLRILAISSLIATKSCGVKTIEETSAIKEQIEVADSVASETLIVSYELFKKYGYKGSFKNFKILLMENPSALNDSYTLFSENGFSGDFNSYLNLIQISPEASSEELRTLFDVLYEEGKLTITFDQFLSKWRQDKGYKDKVFEVVYRDKLYWTERDLFFQKYLRKSINKPSTIRDNGTIKDQFFLNEYIGSILGISAFLVLFGSIIIYRKKIVTLLISIFKTFKSKFFYYSLFLFSLSGLLLGIYGTLNEEDELFLLFIPSIFIIFILWKKNFFNKEPIKKNTEEIEKKHN